MVAASEAAAVPTMCAYVAFGAVVHADEIAGWACLRAHHEPHRINHLVADSMDGASINQAQSFFSRFRRSERGQFHRIAGAYLIRYTQECVAWGSPSVR